MKKREFKTDRGFALHEKSTNMQSCIRQHIVLKPFFFQIHDIVHLILLFFFSLFVTLFLSKVALLVELDVHIHVIAP